MSSSLLLEEVESLVRNERGRPVEEQGHHDGHDALGRSGRSNVRARIGPLTLHSPTADINLSIQQAGEILAARSA